jgi:TM2 domain-containing membrane protein YozV
MNCANHSSLQATAFCRSCGKALCDGCQTKAHGTVFCEEHKPLTETTANPSASPYDPIYGRPEYSPYTAPVAPPPALPLAPAHPASVSPGLAFLLGWIPGVGAIYNGQYAKGLMHVVIFGLTVSILSSHNNGFFEPLLGILLAGFVVYMPFEAYHTAKRRMLGVSVDEFSSLMRFDSRPGAFPMAPLVLIGLGVLFLLSNFNLISFDELVKFWPLGMIAVGAYLLMVRVRNQRRLP